MKLIINPCRGNGRNGLSCLATAAALNVQTEIVKDTNIDSPQLVLDDNCSVVTTNYAITRYLLSITKEDSPFFNNHKLSSNLWSIESFIFWAITHLNKALEGVSKESIHSSLTLLEHYLSNSTSGYLIGDGLSLADIFVWSALVTSSAENSEEFLRSRPLTKQYIATISAQPPTKQALEQLFEGGSPMIARAIISPTSDKEKFYLTTAINYTNGSPHIGHAYEIICSDVIARYHRLFGRDVFFLTGTDEHGQKIAQTAEKMGKTPIELCDMYTDQFKALNTRLNITNDYFVRTTCSKHESVVQTVWKRSVESGDIYLSKYTGWYNVREETFVTEREAKLSDFKDPTSGVPLQKMEEVSYFFKMSKYQDALIQHINNNPEFIQPEIRRNEIIARLKEPLEDLSCSRTTFSWGIPVPGDESHVMYVWFDALTNYLSGIGYTTESDLARYWPADVHIIGKDIIWFHCVIWPCILMSANIPLPKTIYAHGFVVAGDGRKMSKSLDNIIDPVQVLNEYPNADTFRYFTVKAAEMGKDLRFDLDAMVDAHNADLADTLGNMVHRATGLCLRFCNGVVPDCPLPEGEPPFNFDFLAQRVDSLMLRYCLQEALELITGACRNTNKYLTDRAPWAVKDSLGKQQICRAVIEALYMLAHLLEPFIPTAAEEILKKLGTPRSELRALSGWFDNLKPGTPIVVGDVLFAKREPKADRVTPEATSKRSIQKENAKKKNVGLDKKQTN